MILVWWVRCTHHWRLKFRRLLTHWFWFICCIETQLFYSNLLKDDLVTQRISHLRVQFSIWQLKFLFLLQENVNHIWCLDLIERTLFLALYNCLLMNECWRGHFLDEFRFLKDKDFCLNALANDWKLMLIFTIESFVVAKYLTRS